MKIPIYISVISCLLSFFTSCDYSQAKGLYVEVSKGNQAEEVLFKLNSLNQKKINELSDLIIETYKNNNEIQKEYIVYMPYNPNQLDFYIIPFDETNQAIVKSLFYIDKGNNIYLRYIDESLIGEIKIKEINISKYFTEQEKTTLLKIKNEWLYDARRNSPIDEN